MIAATGSAWAHGDPASHYLETDPLYPSFSRQPSVDVQLQLLGLLQATERRGYPIKVALVAGAEDLVDDLTMLKTPQRYATTVASTIEHDLEAPVLVITPFGIGISGNGRRNGVLRPLTARDARKLVRGLGVPPDPEGDDLARTAMAAVRRVARAGGHPSAAPRPARRAGHARCRGWKYRDSGRSASQKPGREWRPSLGSPGMCPPAADAGALPALAAVGGRLTGLDTPRHGAWSAYPTPRRVTTSSGLDGSRSILRLRFQMCASQAARFRCDRSPRGAGESRAGCAGAPVARPGT